MKFPKMTFKGLSQPTVIRKTSEEPANTSVDIDPEVYEKLMSSYDESRIPKKTEEKQRRAAPQSTFYRSEKPNEEDKDSIYSVPKFSIKHQSDVDLQDFRDCVDAKINAATPKNLVVEIDLPLLKSAGDADLDVQERSLVLKSEKPAKYLLELPLPYCVNADAGNAKFDSKHKKLTVTLPVVRKNVSLAEMRDSGVESDHGSPLASLGDETNSNDNEDSVSQESFLDESQSRVEVLSEVNPTYQSPQSTALRTSNFQNSNESFLNPNVKYTLPPFVCNVFDDNLAITINVKNVDSQSINYRILDLNSGIHIVLTSVGAGFFPVYYSLCLKIHEATVASEAVTVEPWDNNVVFTITLKDTTSLERYWVGLDEEFMEAKDLSSKRSLTNKFEQLMVGGSFNTLCLVKNENSINNITPASKRRSQTMRTHTSSFSESSFPQ